MAASLPPLSLPGLKAEVSRGNLMKKSRAFVCDPVCALPYGHNVVGLKYFSDAIKPFFDKIIPLASRSLPEHISLNYGFEREFDFYYHKQIKLDRLDDSAWDIPHQRLGRDTMLELATRDVDSIFIRYGISTNDSVVFPCLDYYGAMGLLTVLRKMNPEHAPTAYFRFIGVMENATSFGGNGLSSLCKKIEIALNDGYKIRLCAETPAYADHLAEILGVTINVVPYPVHAEFVRSDAYPSAEEKAETKEVANNRVFNVACPGSARLDKGYLSLLEIFTNVRRRDPKQTIKFVTQTLPIAEALPYTNYTNQLYATPGVKLLPSSVSEEEMNTCYRQSNLVLLPYDPATYAYRGSAVFMECISRGIPVIALEGSAFCRQIDYYGAGSVVSSIGEFIEAIFRYRDMPSRSISSRMLQARHRYSADSRSALADWIEQ